MRHVLQPRISFPLLAHAEKPGRDACRVRRPLHRRQGRTRRQGADPTQIQWRVTNLNTGSIGIEQIGVATFPNLLWRRQRRKQLYAVARIIARAHGRYGIPMRVRRDPRLPGVTTHHRVGIAGIRPQWPHGSGPPLPAAFRHLLGQDDSTHRLQGDGRRATRQTVNGWGATHAVIDRVTNRSSCSPTSRASSLRDRMSSFR